MTGWLPSRPVLALLVLADLSWSRPAPAAPFHSAAYGYTLEVPADWVQIPQDAVQQMLQAVQGPGVAASIIYDAGFQLKANPQWLEYPYVLVQVVPYRKFGVNRQINEDEFPSVVKSMTGQDLDKAMSQQLSAEAQDLIKDVKAGKPVLESGRKRFLWEVDSTVQGVGRVRGMTAGYFGKESLVQVNYYTRAGDWDQHAAARQSILDSFQFDADKAYSVAAESAAGRRRGKGILRNAIIGAVVAAVVGGVVAMMSKSKKKA
jgi:uncharacterized membrane-anchored protein